MYSIICTRTSAVTCFNKVRYCFDGYEPLFYVDYFIYIYAKIIFFKLTRNHVGLKIR